MLAAPQRPQARRLAAARHATSTSTSCARSSTTGSPGHGHGFMLCSPGAFQIWRRDVLEEVGGYSSEFTCEDIELTFRIHEKFLRKGRDYEISASRTTSATTEGPDNVRKLVSQRERWQRVINETVWHYRRMWFNPRYRIGRADRHAVLPADRGARAGVRAARDRRRSCGAVALGLLRTVDVRRRCSRPWRSSTPR